LKYELPLAQLVDDFFGKLKGATQGYASLEYEDAGWRRSNIVKLQLLVNKEPVDAISRVVHVSQVERLGRQWVAKFKEHVERQMFEVVIQAAAGKQSSLFARMCYRSCTPAMSAGAESFSKSRKKAERS
jgi:translation factor GUF1, mitochondrial